MRTDKAYATQKKQGGGAGMEIHSKEKKMRQNKRQAEAMCESISKNLVNDFMK